MPAKPRNERSQLSMPCDTEASRTGLDRKTAWHRDCPFPLTCPCPAHEHDDPGLMKYGHLIAAARAQKRKSTTG